MKCEDYTQNVFKGALDKNWKIQDATTGLKIDQM